MNKESVFAKSYRDTLTRMLQSHGHALTVKRMKKLPPNIHNKSVKPDPAWTVSDPDMKYSRIV